ncbi:MAG: hypothetical protein JSV41_02620 [Gemmatimonadota bacterium]|nr:MAG: hypothetical protein JSV41_02620 [Gemmatimonadota bacterium]
MTASQRPRHVAVIVLGILFMIQGLLGLFGGTASVLFWAALRAAPVRPGLPGDVAPIARTMLSFPTYAWAVGLPMFAMGALTLAAAIAFVLLRPWGRSALEIVAWVGALCCTAFGFWWATGWLQVTSWARQHEASGGPPPFLDAVGVAVGAATTIVGLIVAALVIWFLRSRTVREAMVR